MTVRAWFIVCVFPGLVFAGPWASSKVWDDGKAEVSVYQAQWKRYGRTYPGRYLTVLVKEPWAPDLNVKADHARPDGFDVLKLNVLRDVPTGIYTYHQTVSTYLRRADLSMVKLAATSSEACGISTADASNGKLRTRSYFDGEGDRVADWPEGALPEDALSVRLRSYVAGKPPREIRVVPSFLANRYEDLVPRAYTLARAVPKKIEVPAGSFEAVRFDLRAPGRLRSYWIERAFPHRWVRYEQEDGTTYVLAKSERLAYWKMHDPGDEAWLPSGLK